MSKFAGVPEILNVSNFSIFHLKPIFSQQPVLLGIFCFFFCFCLAQNIIITLVSLVFRLNAIFAASPFLLCFFNHSRIHKRITMFEIDRCAQARSSNFHVSAKIATMIQRENRREIITFLVAPSWGEYETNEMKTGKARAHCLINNHFRTCFGFSFLKRGFYHAENRPKSKIKPVILRAIKP